MSSKIALSVIIPAKNEAGNIQNLVEEIVASLTGLANFEIVYFDDGSTDQTAAEVLALRERFDQQVQLVQHMEEILLLRLHQVRDCL
mgnify:CR=1 FL=1